MAYKDPERWREVYTRINRSRRKRLADDALKAAQFLLTPGTRCIAYYQVYSETPRRQSDRQGRGCYLWPTEHDTRASQQRVVMRLVSNAGANLTGAYEQLERSRWYRQSERPQLSAALTACQAQGATLIIAKLGRMASSAPFLSRLAASGVPFVACDRPDVNQWTIQDVAIAAQKRKAAKIEKINEMRAAGTLRQQPVPTPESIRRGIETRRQEARDFAVRIKPFIEAARQKGVSYRELAETLNAIGRKTFHGRKWNKQTVRKTLLRAESLPVDAMQITAAAKLMETASATAKAIPAAETPSAPPIPIAAQSDSQADRTAGLWLKAEFRRRWAAGERHPSRKRGGGESAMQWGKVLSEWLATAHPEMAADGRTAGRAPSWLLGFASWSAAVQSPK